MPCRCYNHIARDCSKWLEILSSKSTQELVLCLKFLPGISVNQIRIQLQACHRNHFALEITVSRHGWHAILETSATHNGSRWLEMARDSRAIWWPNCRSVSEITSWDNGESKTSSSPTMLDKSFHYGYCSFAARVKRHNPSIPTAATRTSKRIKRP